MIAMTTSSSMSVKALGDFAPETESSKFRLALFEGSSNRWRLAINKSVVFVLAVFIFIVLRVNYESV